MATMTKTHAFIPTKKGAQMVRISKQLENNSLEVISGKGFSVKTLGVDIFYTPEEADSAALGALKKAFLAAKKRMASLGNTLVSMGVSLDIFDVLDDTPSSDKEDDEEEEDEEDDEEYDEDN